MSKKQIFECSRKGIIDLQTSSIDHLQNLYEQNQETLEVFEASPHLAPAWKDLSSQNEKKRLLGASKHVH